jgi:hypothetical protein
MVRSSPEKLAAALRANLKRRKGSQASQPPEPASYEAAKSAKKPLKTPTKAAD